MTGVLKRKSTQLGTGTEVGGNSVHVPNYNTYSVWVPNFKTYVVQIHLIRGVNFYYSRYVAAPRQLCTKNRMGPDTGARKRGRKRRPDTA